ncbi:MAG: hypothetical protein ACKKL6_03625 [Candidatus Komeilibacteria bacterium]
MNWRLIKFLDNNAVIQNEDNEQIIIPHHLLPADYNIGDEFTLNFNKENNNLSGDKEAIQIINSILQTE